jgi:hypothetical protein
MFLNGGFYIEYNKNIQDYEIFFNYFKNSKEYKHKFNREDKMGDLIGLIGERV